jgi:hypothetical protein
VAHSVHLRDEFRLAGVAAEHLDGKTPIEERDAILDRLAAGTIDIVTNCGVLTEGWDQPEVSCLILARPTKSIGLYLQMVGRVLRAAPGKDDAIILDHAGAVFEHGFVDEPIAWRLAANCSAENRAQGSRARGQAPSLATCPECSAVRSEGQPCRFCGWRPQPKPRAVEVADGELGEVDRDRKVRQVAYSDADKLRFYLQLLWIAGQRGYAAGWAWYRFKDRFGHSPPRTNANPIPPDDAVRRWVRHRDIAYSKAKRAREGVPCAP